MAIVLTYDDPVNKLTDYVFLWLSRTQQAVAAGEANKATRGIWNYVKRTGDISPAVAEALKLMAADEDRPEDEQPSFGGWSSSGARPGRGYQTG